MIKRVFNVVKFKFKKLNYLNFELSLSGLN